MAEALDLPRLASDVMATLAAMQRDDETQTEEDIVAALEHAGSVAVAAGATTAELRALWLLGRWRYDRAEFAEAGVAFGRGMKRAEEI